MKENEISYIIRGAIFNVFNKLGPGLLESVYEVALVCELEKLGLSVERQVSLPVFYDNARPGKGYRVDIIVNGLVAVEIKSTEALERSPPQAVAYLSEIIRLEAWAAGKF